MPKLSNREGYNTWSSFYDDYSNPTIAMDDRHFPSFWSHLSGKAIVEVGCGTGRNTAKLLA